MKLGFTGTSRGLTPNQVAKLTEYVKRTAPVLLIHGGCVGGDDVADQIAATLGIMRWVWPASSHKRVSEEVLRTRMGSKIGIGVPRPPLERNRLIVKYCDMLVACPHQPTEILRSGTWATVRYARKAGKPVVVIAP